MSETSHCICAHTITSLLINASINIPLASQLPHKNFPGNIVLLQGSLETQQSVFRLLRNNKLYSIMLLLGALHFFLFRASLTTSDRVSSVAIGCLRLKLLIKWILIPILRGTRLYFILNYPITTPPPKKIPNPLRQRCKTTQVHLPLWEQFVTGKVAWFVHLFVEVSIFWLDSIRSQKDSCFWRAINVVIQNCLLHLEEEKALRDVLDQLFCHILWVELGTEFEKQGAFFAYILCCYLEQSYQIL